MSVLRPIVDRLAEVGLRLHRASPRGNDRLVLEARDVAGGVVAGQWHRDPATAADVAARTARRGGAARVAVLPDGLLLQRDGADRRLPGLRHLLETPGAELVAHRAERRGVVRLPDRSYAKAVRPEAVSALLHTCLVPAGTDLVATPRVLDVDADRGTVTSAALPGHTLESLLSDRSLTDSKVTAAARAVGAAIRAFHERPAEPDEASAAARHDASAELRVTRRWLDAATAFGLVPVESWAAPFEAAAAGLAAGVVEPPARVHRDLHDKQLVLEPTHPVGLLDLDLVTTGEAAVDVANLLVHLELRHLQGRCSRARADACAEALLDGYRPTRATLARIPAYMTTTRLRLYGVYAFRDVSGALREQLLDRARVTETT